MNYRSKAFLLSIWCLPFFLNAHVVHITSLNQLKSIINSNKNVVIKFYADFCPPCTTFAPIYKNVSEEALFSSLVFVAVNIQQCPDVSSHYGVQSIPTLICIKNGKNIAVERGSKSMISLKSILKKYFSL